MPRITPRQSRDNLGARRRVQDLKTAGGYTVNAVTGKRPSKGISVALGPEHEETHDMAALKRQDIARWASAPEQVAAVTGTRPRGAPDVHYGGWVDNGKAYLDLSEVHPDTPSGRVAARAATVRRSQLANFDLATFETERNPLHPDNTLAGHVPTEQTRADYLQDEGPIRSSGRVSVYRNAREPRGGWAS